MEIMRMSTVFFVIYRFGLPFPELYGTSRTTATFTTA
jgi:hypothetical protein